MAKTKRRKSKGEVVRITLSQEVLQLLGDLAGPNAEVVVRAMAPAYSGNPDFNKFKVG